jgi:hypothetical protein
MITAKFWHISCLVLLFSLVDGISTARELIEEPAGEENRVDTFNKQREKGIGTVFQFNPPFLLKLIRFSLAEAKNSKESTVLDADTVFVVTRLSTGLVKGRVSYAAGPHRPANVFQVSTKLWQ